MPRARGMAAYVRDGYGAFRMVTEHLCVLGPYRNPDLDDQIFDCLLASMATVQADDIRASFLFVGDLKGHQQQEWLGSTTTNRHGVAAFDFAIVSGCAIS